MKSGVFLFEALQRIAERGRSMIGLPLEADVPPDEEFVRLCTTLLTGRGEASGLAVAAKILSLWRQADESRRLELLAILARDFGPDKQRMAKALAAYSRSSDQMAAMELHAAAESRRQKLFRRLNSAQGATGQLLEMRQEALWHADANPELGTVEADLEHLLSSWFNRGFLRLQRIDWSTPANILEKIIRYEAVHQIRSWEDLKGRLAPADRRCFAFFHPQLTDEPLIFVEVALLHHMPSSIDEVINQRRSGEVSARDATTAVFYSISNCQAGLRGISFGNFLLKQVIEEIHDELHGVVNFVTLSPVVGFSGWLDSLKDDSPLAADAGELRALARPGWQEDAAATAGVTERLPALAAEYLLRARNSHGRPRDPVSRFHLGNGARLERINLMGDRSPRAIADAYGLMVNYRYRPEDLIKNHERFAARGEVVAAPEVRRLLAERSHKPRRQRVPA